MANFYQEIRTHPSIDFTKSGWRQFVKLNNGLGARFIRGFILKRDLADYIAAHEARGIHLDKGCQEIRYDDGIHLIIKKVQGIWYITDVIATEEAAGFAPIFFWQRIKAGINDLLAHVLIGWRRVIASGSSLS